MKKVLRLLTITFIVFAISLTNIITTGDLNKNGNIFTYAEVDYLVSKMSLKEKIGQMLILDFRNFDEISTTNKTPISSLPESYGEALKEYGIGGIILFKEALNSKDQIIDLIDEAQKTRTAKDAPNRIPLLVTIDQEGGIVERLGIGTSFISNMALAASNNTANAYYEGNIIGKELKCLGINTNFAPVVDINSNPNNPIIGLRSYSDDPSTVIKYSTSFVHGLSDVGIISTLKHFPGHGDTASDSHTGLPVVYKSYEEIAAFELKPFKALIEQGVDLILTAHIQYPQIENETYYSSLKNEEITLPATLSNKIINGILRDELGYKGVVVSDSLVMDAIDTYFAKEETAKLAINAGIDMLLMPLQIDCLDDLKELKDYIQAIEDMVLNDEISEKTINKHVKRILTLKSNHNLLNYEELDLLKRKENANNILKSDEFNLLKENIIDDSITEYLNDGTVPLLKDDLKKMTVIYPYNSAYLPLSKGIEKVKDEGLLNKSTTVEYLRYHNSINVSSFKKSLYKTDCLIIVSDIYSPEEFHLESPNSFKFKFILELIESFKRTGRKVIVISSNLPYDALYYQDANAVILTYNNKGYFENDEDITSSSYEETIEKIFTGDFKGKLPITLN